MPDSTKNKVADRKTATKKSPAKLWKLYVDLGVKAREKYLMPQAAMYLWSAMKVALENQNWFWVVGTYTEILLMPYVEFTHTLGENVGFLDLMLRYLRDAEGVMHDHPFERSAELKAIVYMRYAQYYQSIGELDNALSFSQRSITIQGKATDNPELRAPHALIRILSGSKDPKWIFTLEEMLKKARIQPYKKGAWHRLIVVCGCLLRLAEAHMHLGHFEVADNYLQEAAKLAKKLKDVYYYPHRSDHVQILQMKLKELRKAGKKG